MPVFEGVRTFHELVVKFLEQRLQGERIDSLPLAPEHRSRKKADYVMFDRRAVVEVKSLVSDREQQFKRVMQKWQHCIDNFGLFYGEVPLQRILRKNPYKDQINGELRAAVTSVLYDDFRDANHQIAGTKQSLNLPDALGVVVVVNETIDLLDPTILMYKVKQLLALERGGTRRFRHIHYAWVPTAAHALVGRNDEKAGLVISLAAPEPERVAEIGWLQAHFMREWGAFLGLPVGYLDVSDAMTLPVTGRSRDFLQSSARGRGPTGGSVGVVVSPADTPAPTDRDQGARIPKATARKPIE